VTQKGTLASFTTDIPVDSLPQTIQDAIKVTRQLEIQYLWVDALCIIQDCDVDKAVEINNMGNVYQNATVTIAAAAATCVKDGFLQPRERIQSCRIPIYDPDAAAHYEFHGRSSLPSTAPLRTRTKIVWMSAPRASSDSDEPLYSRGWTLQERLLSPRMLVYGLHELTWQCQSKSTISIGRTLYRRSTGCKRLPAGVFVYKRPNRRELPSSTQSKQLWKSIVEDYSRRQLSFREDRLPGIAGIAEKLQTYWKDAYVAGLWQGSLISHLGWRRAGRSHRRLDSTPYLAPTWSWVSLDRAVKFDLITRPDAEVLECFIAPLVPEAPFGQVRAGHLRLRAAAAKGEIPRSRRLSSGFDITLDYNLPRSDVTEVIYLFLGSFSSSKDCGLLVSETPNGSCRRIGQFRALKPARKAMFESQSLERKEWMLI